ncbi:MAG: hypothetical protein AAB225_03940 [Acidobacteriota bacterium]
MTAMNSGHEVMGYGSRINHSGNQIGTESDSMGFTLRPLDAGSLNDNLRQLITPPPDYPYRWGQGGHWSWNNVKA